jgi:uncharacterized protein (TIGR02145 family)
MKTLHYLILSIFFLSSCDKFDWHNPYDPECPKELFTPSSPGATMEGNSVKLTWSQQNDDISGFALFRSAEGESITNLTQIQKSTTQYIDANITPGKKYTYYVVAVAGTNKSDTVKAEIIPVIPVTISTGSFTELAATSAKVSGNITSAGGGAVTSRGICWSTTPNPTVNSSKTTEGNGVGQFTSTLTNLLPSTIYYARAYGENSRGISYGSEITFTTLGPPKLTTTAVSNITATTATSGGTIISDGGSLITAKGVVWSTSPSPTIDLATKINEGTGSGSFTSSLVGLSTNIKYYVRAYAINSFGIAYGEQFVFYPLLPLTVVDNDGNVYKTIKIGNQEWMAENLRTTRFQNGDQIPYATKTNFLGYTWYNDSLSNIKSGAFYSYFTYMDSRSIAPLGWRVPTEADWVTLINFLGGSSVAGDKLKADSTWITRVSPQVQLSGFNAFASGARDCSAAYVARGQYAQFGVNKVDNQGNITVLYILNNSPLVSLPQHFNCNAATIRCIKIN